MARKRRTKKKVSQPRSLTKILPQSKIKQTFSKIGLKHKDLLRIKRIKVKVEYEGSKKPRVITVKLNQKSLKRDLKRKALPPGKRISRTGKVYYEYRANRSDTYDGI